MEVKINISRRTIMDILVVLQLILVVVLGSFTISLSKKIDQVIGKSGDMVALAAEPSVINPGSEPAAGEIVDIKITKDDHMKGDFDAPITIVEFSDIECPFCGNHHPTLQKLVDDYPGKIRWVWKHYPLSFHTQAQKAAEATECAGEQGKFWEYMDHLFANQTLLSLQFMKDSAKTLGLNTDTFNRCLDSGKYAGKISAEEQEGVALGVDGTPATFINGKLISGAVPYSQLKAEVDRLLK